MQSAAEKSHQLLRTSHAISTCQARNVRRQRLPDYSGWRITDLFLIGFKPIPLEGIHACYKSCPKPIRLLRLEALDGNLLISILLN